MLGQGHQEWAHWTPAVQAMTLPQKSRKGMASYCQPADEDDAKQFINVINVDDLEKSKAITAVSSQQ